jgi:hypothetical protein
MKASFTIQWLKERRPNRQRASQSFEVEELRVGSGGSADVRIADRLVAGVALKLRPTLGGLSLEPIDLFAGAFLNGIAIAGHEILAPGGALQIGQTLIELAMPAATQYVLSIDEGYLDHQVRRLSLDPTTKEFASLVHDGPPEASWGRDPVHANLLKGATALAAVLLLAFPWLKGTGLGSAGPLSLAHQNARNAEGKALACADCHGAGAETSDQKCLVCHAEHAPGKGAHPPASAFAASSPPNAPPPQNAAAAPAPVAGPLAVAAEKSAHCSQCHHEHRGPNVPPWDPVHASLAAAQRDPLLPAPAPAGVCSSCHGNELPAKPMKEVTATRDRARPAVDVALQFESFSHAVHLHPSALFERGQAITCATCHVRTAAPADGRDFAAVTYESCLPCHAWRLKDRVHGRNSGVCTDCHEKASAGAPAGGPAGAAAEVTREMKSVTVPNTSTRFAFAPQDHPVTRQACATCHVTGRIGAEREVKGELFRHDRHLTVFQESGALDEDKARRECAACHVSVRESKSLADLWSNGRLEIDLGACKVCHKGEAKVAGSEPGPPLSPRPDIVHRAHAGNERGAASADVLARGCFSCHSLAPDGLHMPVQKESERCASCHEGHARISCSTCHQDLDHLAPTGSPPRCERSVINEKEAVVTKRGGVETFRHGSLNHAALECDTCHTGVDRSQRLKTIALPGPTQEICVRCHALARYHR